MFAESVRGSADEFVSQYLVLQRSRREQDRRKLFVIEGVGAFVAAVNAGAALRAILHCPRLLRSPVAQKLVRQRKRAGVPVAKLSPERFREVSGAPRACGVAAIVEQRLTPL
ncbi:MAG: hypothetical protein AAF907_03190, partial [Planctomycetota bacterium]